MSVRARPRSRSHSARPSAFSPASPRAPTPPMAFFRDLPSRRNILLLSTTPPDGPLLTSSSRSPLALAQAYMTRDLLKKNFPELAEEGALEICIIKVRSRPLRYSIVASRSPPDRTNPPTIFPGPPPARRPFVFPSNLPGTSPDPVYPSLFRPPVTRFSTSPSPTSAARVSSPASSTRRSSTAASTSAFTP